MESRLKKLWTRRKSKGLDGQLDGQFDPAAKSLSRSKSTDLKASSTSKIQSGAQNASHAIQTSTGNAYAFGQFDRSATTADSSLRSPPTGKLQPRFLGVSRPTTPPSSPHASGRGNRAVGRPAGPLNIAEEEFQASAQKYTEHHIATKPPRYMDISLLSKPPVHNIPTSPKVYNEDVAERNLDLARVALDTSEQQLSPSSPSMYQEDVAARNAFPPLPGGNNTVRSLSHSKSHRHMDQPPQMPGETRPMTTEGAINHQSVVRISPAAGPATTEIHEPNSNISHSRQLSDQSWGSQSRGQARHGANQPSAAISSYQRTTVPDTFHVSSAGTPLSSRSAVPPVPPPKQLLGAHVAQAGSHHLFRSENLRNYVLSQSELIHRSPLDRGQALQSSTKSVDDQDGIQPSDRSVRSPSALSNTSSVKRSIHLAHRTIMDLTGDDAEVFSEMTPATHYSASPVVDSTKAFTMHKFEPTTANISRTITPDTTPEPVPPEVKARSQQQPSTFSPVVGVISSPSADAALPTRSIAEVRTNTASSVNTFSPISTLAHLEPSRSVMTESQVTETGPDPSRSHPNLKKDHDLNRERISTMPRALEAQMAVSKEQSAVGPTRVESDLVKPKTPEKQGELEAILESRRSSEKLTTTEGIERHVMLPKEQPLSETNYSSVTPQSHPIIEMTPDSLHSIDFVDPSRAFGVAIRDFASSPTKAFLESVPEDIEPSLSTRPRRPADATAEPESGATSHDSGSGIYTDKPVKRTSAYSSTFDEDEFAYRQAEIRAALIRLQQSLNEDFLTQPLPPATYPSRLRHHSSLSDGTPVAPSSIFAQARNFAPLAADYGHSVGTSTSSDEAGAHTSYHTLVTTSNINGQPYSLYSAGGVDDSPLNSKGKQKFVIDPNNGPGPSIVDDDHEAEYSLPLPPRLHLNGTALYRNLNQAPVPPSPGEISLSSFPIPVSSPRHSFVPGPRTSEPIHPQTIHHSHHNSAGTGRVLRRPSSQRSEASSASAFSIPYHMIPDRSSSVRDRLVREVD